MSGSGQKAAYFKTLHPWRWLLADDSPDISIDDWGGTQGERFSFFMLSMVGKVAGAGDAINDNGDCGEGYNLRIPYGEVNYCRYNKW